jgi:hypothetical protein
MPTSIYRLFGPFLSFFGPLSRFFRPENHLVWFVSFLWNVTISVTLGIGIRYGYLGHFKGPLVKKSFFQLFGSKLVFHIHFLHLVVFFTLP